MLNEGMEALRQIATTSLFLQNEQKPTTNRIVPIIKEPEKATEEAPIEMKKLDTTLHICDVSDDEDEEEDGAPSYSNQTEYLVQSQSKLARQRLPMNQQQLRKDREDQNDPDSILMETSLMVMNPPPLSTGKATISPSSSHSYDLPPATPHQYSRIEQHTPGQIIDTGQSLQLPPALPSTLLLPVSSSNQSNTRTSGGLLAVNTSTPVTVTSQPQLNTNLLSPPPTITSEPELVLSPAKLGQ